MCKFSSLVEELLLRFVDNVRFYDGILISGQKEAKVCLYAPLGCDGERVRVNVGLLSRKDGTAGQYIALGDNRYDKHQYYVDSKWGSSDEVLRHDILSPTLINNNQPERELGLNDQPVSPDEINELAALMERAEYVPSSYEQRLAKRLSM